MRGVQEGVFADAPDALPYLDALAVRIGVGDKRFAVVGIQRPVFGEQRRAAGVDQVLDRIGIARELAPAHHAQAEARKRRGKRGAFEAQRRKRSVAYLFDAFGHDKRSQANAVGKPGPKRVGGDANEGHAANRRRQMQDKPAVGKRCVAHERVQVGGQQGEAALFGPKDQRPRRRAERVGLPVVEMHRVGSAAPYHVVKRR